MSWIEKLYETYERCDGAPQFENEPLMPVCHAVQQAHIEIVLDDNGCFRNARYVQKKDTVIPATEQSAARTGKKPPPHPLCDKIQYCAADYPKFGGAKDSFYTDYVSLLRRWCESPYSHPKVQAVLTYIEKGAVVKDLVNEKLLFCDSRQHLLTEWNEATPPPDIFRMLSPKGGKRDQGDAFVRWRVQSPGDLIDLVSENPEVRKNWILFDTLEHATSGLCMVSGEATRLASSHPKRLRHGADGAKLISSNDDSGYTFRGRFISGDEACGVGFEVSQKAHSALRWLIARQSDAGKTAEQVFVSWSIGGQAIPDPLKNTAQLFLDAPPGDAAEPQYQGDAGQLFAVRLNKLIAGYAAKLGPTEGIIVMGLDSATPGRMAIIFYRELTGSELLARVLAWHMDHAWQQDFSRELRFVGVPAPKDIAEAAYGRRRLDDKLRKCTAERLLPCIVDGEPVPRDLVESAVRRVCNRVGLKSWEWEKCLGIACSLYRGWRKEENYQMSLEENRTSRDYLFGRLLAIADHLEQRALHVAGEDRDTNAARMMQRFADHPCSTWRNIRHALLPYEARLRSKRPPLLHRLNVLLDDVMGKFQTNEFTDDGKLSGEYLLGFHCQRSALWQKPENTREETGEL
jgi:CRISPR-associated protein Csd1